MLTVDDLDGFLLLEGEGTGLSFSFIGHLSTVLLFLVPALMS